MQYDAIFLVSFGGPEGPADVIPFLENVLRGKNVPRERMLEVAQHYDHFGGKSPINDQNRLLLTRLQEELARDGPRLPVYWGNRNWAPYIADAVSQMKNDGVGRALAFVTSAYSSYSGCRQYREDIQRAQESVGPGAPAVDKIRAFYNHPGFIETMVANASAVLEQLPGALVLFTAHSIPLSMSKSSRYEQQLLEASRLVAGALGIEDWRLVWQSRSGPPSQPWLEPDVSQVLRQTEAREVVIVPIGFLSDHMEVLYDLDEEARHVCEERGIRMVRAATAGAHPRFITMIRELIVERIEGQTNKPALGILGANHDVCPIDCCPSPKR